MPTLEKLTKKAGCGFLIHWIFEISGRFLKKMNSFYKHCNIVNRWWEKQIDFYWCEEISCLDTRRKFIEENRTQSSPCFATSARLEKFIHKAGYL